MPEYRIWADVLKLVNELTTDIYKKNKSDTYLRKHAMSEAYKSLEYQQAKKQYETFKKNNPAEWSKLQTASTSKKKKKTKK
jgi:hypothetical protein